MTTDNRTNDQLAERLRQFAESQAMDFDNPHIAMTLEEIADRLTGTITEAQVEAAAKAIREVDARAALIADVDLAEYRARAALVAAQGAAPQAEQATYLNVAHSSVLAGSINARRAAREVSAMQLIDAIYDPDEDDANDSVRYGYVLEQFERLRIIYADLDDPDAGPAPVPSSSGVDEAKLARLLCEKNYISPDGKPTCAACRDKAREVAEWLEGQGNDARE